MHKEMERGVMVYFSKITPHLHWIAGTLVVAAMAQLVVALVS